MIAPLLVTISAQFGLSVAAVTVVATVHLLSYGAMQVVWALLSDRYGRVRIMRLALIGAALLDDVRQFVRQQPPARSGVWLELAAIKIDVPLVGKCQGTCPMGQTMSLFACVDANDSKVRAKGWLHFGAGLF